MNKSRFLVALAITLLLALAAPFFGRVEAAQAQVQFLANSPWPMFRCNPQHSGQSYSSGPKIPVLKWSFTTGGPIRSSPAIGSDGTIYVGSNDYKLYAINPDGTQKWSFTTGGPIISSPAIGSDGTIYIGSDDGRLYAINPDGTQKWSFTTGGRIRSSPTLSAVGIHRSIYIVSQDGNLYAINPDGTRKWSFDVRGHDNSSPAVGLYGTIYVGPIAINPDGTLKWHWLPAGHVQSSPAVGPDGTIYFGSHQDHLLYAMNPKGTAEWLFLVYGISSSPAVTWRGIPSAISAIYVGSIKGLYAINPDGTEKWRFRMGAVDSSPAIGLLGDTIYVGSDDKNLYAINYDGTEEWRFSTGGSVGSSPAIGADNTIYVGSDDGKLYAIGEARVISFDLSSGWDTKELFVPIYYRPPGVPGKVVLGVGNKRDMWYLVKVYKRQTDQPWQEIHPFELPYLAPWSEKTFCYAPEATEEIKLEVWNDLNDETLRALWTLDFATRALLGVSSHQISNPKEFVVKLMTFYNEYAQFGGYLATEQWKEAALQLGKILSTSSIARETFATLLKDVGIQVTVAQIAARALLMPTHYIVNVPTWWYFLENVHKEPFNEEVIITFKEIPLPRACDVRVTKSLTLTRGPYYVGQTITARFTVANKGKTPIVLNVLTVGGRGPKGDTDVQDFTFKPNIMLNANESYDYEGELKLLDSGPYHFFIAYQTSDGEWNVSVPTEAGAVNTLDISVDSVPERWVAAELCSPGELRVYDSRGRITGLVNGQVKCQIPHSFYCAATVVILSPADSYTYEVVGTSKGSYKLVVTKAIGQEVALFIATDIPTLAKSSHRYTIDWDALSQSRKGVTIQIDSEGDGKFERSGAIGNELTLNEFQKILEKRPPFWIWITVGVVIILIMSLMLRHRLARK